MHGVKPIVLLLVLLAVGLAARAASTIGPWTLLDTAAIVSTGETPP